MRSLLAVLILWAAVFLPGLGSMELKGEEGRRILPAREMLRTGDYVLPYSEGKPYHRKPPGINWAIAGVFKITGVQNEWTARLPSVLAVLALALLACRLGENFLGRGGGIALAITLLVSVGTVEKGRLAEIEAFYVSMVGIGFLWWMNAWMRHASPWRLWLPTILPLALANMAKGPVWMVFFYAVIIAILWRGREIKSLLLHPAHLLSLSAALAPMIGWGMLIRQRLEGMPLPAIRNDAGTMVESATPASVWWQQISERMSFATIDWADWAVLPFRSLILFAPWVVVALFLLWKTRGVESQHPHLRRTGDLEKGIFWGTIASAVVFMILPATRARYLWPLLVPVMVWSVLVIRRTLGQEGRCGRLADWIALAMIGVLVSAGFILPAALGISGWQRYVAWGLSVLLILLGRRILLLPWPQPLFWRPAVLFAFATLLSSVTLIPWGVRQDNVRTLAARFTPFLSETSQIAAFNPGPQPMLFYLGAGCIEVTKLSEMPDSTTHVLVDPKAWDGDSVVGNNLRNRRFTEELVRATDQRLARPRDYVLIAKAAQTQ